MPRSIVPRCESASLCRIAMSDRYVGRIACFRNGARGKLCSTLASPGGIPSYLRPRAYALVFSTYAAKSSLSVGCQGPH